jgi:hypothetical protein
MSSIDPEVKRTRRTIKQLEKALEKEKKTAKRLSHHKELAIAFKSLGVKKQTRAGTPEQQQDMDAAIHHTKQMRALVDRPDIVGATMISLGNLHLE